LDGEYGIYFEYNKTIQELWFKKWTDIGNEEEWGYMYWMTHDRRYVPYLDYLFEIPFRNRN
jgi:hypothetical protein